MSRYTTQVRWIVETESSSNALTISDKCREAAPKIFNFNYPFYDESKRLEFETDFLRHYYVTEICAETVGLWKLFLEDWLLTNMPFWNQRFAAIERDFDFLKNYNFTESYENSADSVGSLKRESENQEQHNEKTDSTSDTGAHQMNKYYEVPSKNIVDITDHLNNATTLDGSTTGKGSTANNGGSSSNGTVTDATTKNDTRKGTLTRSGWQGTSPAELQAEYLSNMRNLKKEFYDAADDLFMSIW